MRSNGPIALVAALAGTLAVVAPVAQGGRRADPVAETACAKIAGGGCQESGNIKMPAHGTGSQFTDVVPAQATQASAFLEPLSTNDLAAFDSTWEDVVAGYPNLSKVKSTPVRRVITCAILARAETARVAYAYGLSAEGEVRGQNIYAAYLSICIQVTVLAQRQATGQATAGATAGCAQANVSVPFLVSRTASGYVFKLSGQTSKATRRGPLAVSCGAKGNGLLIKTRVRARRRKLHQVIGPHLRIGFSNPTSASETIHTTFTLK
jgi:hypothetical protein